MHVCIDDSGTIGRTDKICLAAIMAPDANLEALSSRWARLLGKYSLPFMHTSDFLSMGKAYREFDDELPYLKRLEIVGEFSQIILDEVDHGVVSVVDAEEFRSRFGADKKRITPQELCFSRILAFANHLIDEGYANAPVSFLIDDDPKISQRLLGLWHKVRKDHTFARELHACISFVDDKFVLPVQAADLFALNVMRAEFGTQKDDVAPFCKPSRFRYRVELLTGDALGDNAKLIRDAIKDS